VLPSQDATRLLLRDAAWIKTKQERPVSKTRTFAIALVGAASIAVAATAVMRKPARSAPAQIYFQLYEPQKVVYHVHTGGGLFGSHNRDLISIMNNHLRAVGEGFLDLRLVLQGNGIDILQQAMKDERLAEAISDLRRKGVRFLICYNTLVGHGIDYEKDLYGVKKEDIVSAGVAEVARLEAQGFVYLKF
jgi:intracellular sulfur oxidation DsrE/DsrF family protein